MADPTTLPFRASLPMTAALLVLAAACAPTVPQVPPAPAPESPAAEAHTPPSVDRTPAAATARPAPTPGATSPEITAADVELRIGILAHDSMRGRDTGSPEKALAAEYLAGEAERLGLAPGGENGTYFQPVPLERRITRVHAEVGGSEPRVLDAERIRYVSGAGGLPASARERVEGPVHFGGYLFDPEVGDEDFTLPELTGSVIIVRMGGPEDTPDPASTQPRMPLAFLFGPQSPAAAIFLVAEDDLDEFWDYAGDLTVKGAVGLDRGEPIPDGPPFFLISPEAVEELTGEPFGELRGPIRNLGELTATLESRVERFQDRNVVAIVPGADPDLRDEYMTLGAHYDHVGVGTPVNGDSIYNGADDNASGTTALLEVAEYLAHLPEGERPRRSVLFTWHAAEEAGLLGSEHFTDFPTVPRDAMVAHINMDMVGRNHPDSLFLVGSRRLSTEFGGWVEEANAALSAPFILDYTFDAPGHPEQLYCRSDHWNFARYGIPVVKMGSGLHDDYHKPSDTPELIENGKVAQVARLAALLTLRVANAPARPAVDQPVSPLGTPCQG